VKDVHEHNHLARHSTVLWREVGSNPTRLIIDWATKENLAVSVPVHDLAVVFSLKTAAPIVLGDFTVDAATRRTYDQNGAPIANPPLTLGAIR
jgi:hypothetical protein